MKKRMTVRFCPGQVEGWSGHLLREEERFGGGGDFFTRETSELSIIILCSP